jgi:hypothetical protein
MRLLWKKGAAIGFLAFLGLWVGGMIRGLTLPPPAAPEWHLPVNEILSRRSASANNLHQLGLEQTPLPLVVDQADVERIRVYEKDARLTAATAAFDHDAALVRFALEQHQALVFNEKGSGINPGRRLTLEIGVHPEEFDALVGQLREIARLESVSVEQRDRTGEFRQLHAERQSLKNHLDSLLKLRGGKNLSIEDELKLEQKIQDIEKPLQALGVQLGDLLGKESFYQVYVTLWEYQPGGWSDRTYNLPWRLAQAFLWALPWWCTVALAFVALAGACLSIQALWPKRRVSGVSRSPGASAT